MIKIKLFTEFGDFVHEGTIPPFDTAPDVIVWGTRIFKRWTEVEYRECFAVALVN